VNQTWDPAAPGIVRLPSSRLVRGRGLSRPLPDSPIPAFGVWIACAGGRGRTGTALACLAILDGVPSTEAVAFVREHYDPRAVETPAQRRYVARWPGNDEGTGWFAVGLSMTD
jgi:hypothetical protein